MTPKAFCSSGAAEGLKAAIHGLLLVTAGTCVTYNAVAYVYRRERHLLRNGIVYGLVVAYEYFKIRHHLSTPPP